MYYPGEPPYLLGEPVSLHVSHLWHDQVYKEVEGRSGERDYRCFDPRAYGFLVWWFGWGNLRLVGLFVLLLTGAICELLPGGVRLVFRLVSYGLVLPFDNALSSYG